MKNYLLRCRIALVGVLLIASCKEPLITGTDVLPSDGDLAAIFTDTLTVKSWIVREDSLRADELSNSIVGAMHDPDFGNTYAGFFTQVFLPSNNIDLGTSLTFDSLVITLAYDDSYGTTDLPQTFEVYRMTESIHKDSIYYSNELFGFDASLLGQRASHIPNFEDSLNVLEGKQAPHLRIKLDDTFGQDLLNQSGGGNFADNDAFLQYLKGFYITIDTTLVADGLVYFDLNSALSKLTLYYKDGNNTPLFFNFEINKDSARVAHFAHNYNGSTVEAFFLDGNESDSLLFLQGLAGFRINLAIPYITNLGDVVVNKAELVVNVKSGTVEPFDAPVSVAASEADTMGNPATLLRIVELDDDNLQYIYNLPNYTQRLLQGNEVDHGFVLFPVGSAVEANRAILKGQENIKLNLTFTKIR